VNPSGIPPFWEPFCLVVDQKSAKSKENAYLDCVSRHVFWVCPKSGLISGESCLPGCLQTDQNGVRRPPRRGLEKCQNGGGSQKVKRIYGKNVKTTPREIPGKSYSERTFFRRFHFFQ